MKRAFCPLCGYLLHPTCPACEGFESQEAESEGTEEKELSGEDQDRIADAFFAGRLREPCE